MATSKLMASSSTSQNSGIRRNASSAASPSSSSTTLPAFFHNQQYSSKNQGDDSNPDSNLMTLDRFLENVYADDQAAAGSALRNAEITGRDVAGDTGPVGESRTAPVVRKTVEDVWREIVEGKRLQQKEAPAVECKEEAVDEMMTLEDFLVKAGAVDEPAVAPGHGEVKIEPDGERFSGGSFMFDGPVLGTQHSMEEVVGFGNVMEASGSGRGKRRAILEPLDKAALQRQRRMIKNRESAARSRERKQVKDYCFECFH